MTGRSAGRPASRPAGRPGGQARRAGQAVGRPADRRAGRQTSRQPGNQPARQPGSNAAGSQAGNQGGSQDESCPGKQANNVFCYQILLLILLLLLRPLLFPLLPPPQSDPPPQSSSFRPQGRQRAMPDMARVSLFIVAAFCFMGSPREGYCLTNFDDYIAQYVFLSERVVEDCCCRSGFAPQGSACVVCVSFEPCRFLGVSWME